MISLTIQVFRFVRFDHLYYFLDKTGEFLGENLYICSAPKYLISPLLLCLPSKHSEMLLNHALASFLIHNTSRFWQDSRLSTRSFKSSSLSVCQTRSMSLWLIWKNSLILLAEVLVSSQSRRLRMPTLHLILFLTGIESGTSIPPSTMFNTSRQ